MITGDDILIEYVERIGRCLKGLPEDSLTYFHVEHMEKFITHYVWHQGDMTEAQITANNPSSTKYDVLKSRLNNRLGEMQDRRRRLIKYTFKKENRLN